MDMHERVARLYESDEDRCLSFYNSSMRCDQPRDHYNPHRFATVPGVTWWAGEGSQRIVLRNRCGEWPCRKNPDHDGSHNDGFGHSWMPLAPGEQIDA